MFWPSNWLIYWPSDYPASSLPALVIDCINNSVTGWHIDLMLTLLTYWVIHSLIAGFIDLLLS